MNVGSMRAVVRSVVVGAASVLALQAGVLATTASAQYSSSQSYQWQDAAITRAFRDVLRREPSSSEMRRYRGLMTDDHWSEADVARALRNSDEYRNKR